MGTYKSPYSTEQLNQYVERIQLPSKYHPSSNPMLDIDLLTALHVHQISAIPYENLDLHYSSHHSVSLDPQLTFNKIVLKGYNRGGYCMEDSLLFLWMLQGYGFDVYPTGVRIRLREDGVPKGDFMGLVHLVLICTLQSGAKYVLDVAFGGDGPTKPLPLTENTPTLNLGTQEVRYVYESIAQNAPRPLTQPQKYWTYQYRNGPDKPWNSHYIFTETEYLVNDFNVFNHFTSSGQTFQRTTILVVKFLRSEAEKAPLIVGKLMLVNGTLKRNITGRTEMIKECKNEAERIEVLKEWFGITLTEEEERGIGGLITELRDAGASIVAA